MGRKRSERRLQIRKMQRKAKKEFANYVSPTKMPPSDTVLTQMKDGSMAPRKISDRIKINRAKELLYGPPK